VDQHGCGLHANPTQASIRRYDVVVLPDATCMGDNEAAAFDAYVGDGGNLVVTAETGMLDEYGEGRITNALTCLPIAQMRQVKRNMFATYLRIGDGELDFPDTKIIMLDGVYVDAEPKPGAETLLRVQPPSILGRPTCHFQKRRSQRIRASSSGRMGAARSPTCPSRRTGSTSFTASSNTGSSSPNWSAVSPNPSPYWKGRAASNSPSDATPRPGRSWFT
jgi:hypothetical protein